MKAKRLYKNSIELLQGTLDLLILQTLQWGPRHGYGISQAIRTGSGDVLQVDTGSLYPALHRIEATKLISSEWGVSATNRKVKIYKLTSAGRKYLAAEEQRWGQLTLAVSKILRFA